MSIFEFCKPSSVYVKDDLFPFFDFGTYCGCTEQNILVGFHGNFIQPALNSVETFDLFESEITNPVDIGTYSRSTEQ